MRQPTDKVNIPLLQLEDDLTYQEYPIRILGSIDRKLRQRIIPFVKIQWSNHSEEEATWEKEEDIRKDFSYLFTDSGE